MLARVGVSLGWYWSAEPWCDAARANLGSRRALDLGRNHLSCKREYKPCVNLALRSWKNVEVSIKHRVYGVGVCVLRLFLLFFFFFLSFIFFHILETGNVKTPSPNGHARILANTEIYGRSLMMRNWAKFGRFPAIPSWGQFLRRKREHSSRNRQFFSTNLYGKTTQR